MRRFDNEITIKKVALIREEIEILKREHSRNEKIFNDLCDSLDGVVSGDLLQEASLKLTIILERADSIYKNLQDLMKIFEDLKSELLN